MPVIQQPYQNNYCDHCQRVLINTDADEPILKCGVVAMNETGEHPPCEMLPHCEWHTPCGRLESETC